MAALAMRGLGASSENSVTYLRNYSTKLASAEDDYLQLRAEYLEQIDARGSDAVLDHHLPDLISGWVKDAFHPLIRIAFGYEWQIPTEIAAGLAYLRLCGADERIASAAGLSVLSAADSDALFSIAAQLPPAAADRATFTSKVQSIVQSAEFEQAAFTVADNVRHVSRSALEVFDQTHDFFALHLVTGAHAFRVLYAFAGPTRDAIFNLGLVAACAAAEAEDRQATETLEVSRTDDPTDWSTLLRLDGEPEDEHRIKLAYSCMRQAEFFNDPLYLQAASAYLRASFVSDRND
jgi:hypothetical protein